MVRGQERDLDAQLGEEDDLRDDHVQGFLLRESIAQERRNHDEVVLQQKDQDAAYQGHRVGKQEAALLTEEGVDLRANHTRQEASTAVYVVVLVHVALEVLVHEVESEIAEARASPHDRHLGHIDVELHVNNHNLRLIAFIWRKERSRLVL